MPHSVFLSPIKTLSILLKVYFQPFNLFYAKCFIDEGATRNEMEWEGIALAVDMHMRNNFFFFIVLKFFYYWDIFGINASLLRLLLRFKFDNTLSLLCKLLA
jgi:hypothetical protein